MRYQDQVGNVEQMNAQLLAQARNASAGRSAAGSLLDQDIAARRMLQSDRLTADERIQGTYGERARGTGDLAQLQARLALEELAKRQQHATEMQVGRYAGETGLITERNIPIMTEQARLGRLADFDIRARTPAVQANEQIMPVQSQAMLNQYATGQQGQQPILQVPMLPGQLREPAEAYWSPAYQGAGAREQMLGLAGTNEGLPSDGMVYENTPPMVTYDPSVQLPKDQAQTADYLNYLADAGAGRQTRMGTMAAGDRRAADVMEESRADRASAASDRQLGAKASLATRAYEAAIKSEDPTAIAKAESRMDTLLGTQTNDPEYALQAVKDVSTSRKDTRINAAVEAAEKLVSVDNAQDAGNISGRLVKIITSIENGGDREGAIDLWDKIIGLLESEINTQAQEARGGGRRISPVVSGLRLKSFIDSGKYKSLVKALDTLNAWEPSKVDPEKAKAARSSRRALLDAAQTNRTRGG